MLLSNAGMKSHLRTSKIHQESAYEFLGIHRHPQGLLKASNDLTISSAARSWFRGDFDAILTKRTFISKRVSHSTTYDCLRQFFFNFRHCIVLVVELKLYLFPLLLVILRHKLSSVIKKLSYVFKTKNGFFA